MRTRLHPPVRLRNILQAMEAVDNRLDLSLGDQRPYSLLQLLSDFGLALHRLRAKARAGDGELFCHDESDIDLALNRFHVVDEDQPAAWGERTQIADGVRAAYHVEDHVDAAIRGQLADSGLEIGGT